MMQGPLRGAAYQVSLLFITCSAHFLMELRTTSPGLATTPNSLVAPISISKFPKDLPTTQSYGDIFSVEDPFSQMTLISEKLTLH